LDRIKSAFDNGNVVEINGRIPMPKKNYSQLGLDDFSDDDSDGGGNHQSGFRDEPNNEADEYIRNQQVRPMIFFFVS